MNTKEQAVHMIYKGGRIIGFFTRDEENNENIIFRAEKASLDEIGELFNKEETKL